MSMQNSLRVSRQRAARQREACLAALGACAPGHGEHSVKIPHGSFENLKRFRSTALQAPRADSPAVISGRMDGPDHRRFPRDMAIEAACLASCATRQRGG
jgi:hypothetical protein